MNCNKLREVLDRHNKYGHELSYNELKELVPVSETEKHDVYIQKMYIIIGQFSMTMICLVKAHFFITDSTAVFGVLSALFFGLYIVYNCLSISYFRSPHKHNSWKPEVVVILF